MEQSTLILSRHPRETLIVSGDSPDAIAVAPIRMRGGEFQLQVRAPREVPVDRLEITRLKQAEGWYEKASKAR